MDNIECTHRCCFTGHRPEKLSAIEKEVKEKLKKAIKQAIEDGFTEFISGMAYGVDMWAAEIVLEEKENNKDIKLICTPPYDGFEKYMKYDEKECYINIMKKADIVKFVCDHYSPYCFQLRNCYMVDNSARVIAAYNGSKGGTQNTVKYAVYKDVEIINIFGMNYHQESLF